MIESGTLLQGRFLIEERIGQGGMGAVYRAVDQKFGTSVAIKETFYGDDELSAAFEREARLLNGLHHPIFPHVSDYFSDESGHFLVMEFIEGEDLSAILKRGEVFSVAEVMRWTLDLLDGLDYLHSQDPPVVHRDIKPNNLKLTSRGNIVLLDFGMAKETSGNTLGMRSVFGYSRRYSPLEQIEGTGTDARSDIFSLGATVYHLLTGTPPVDVLGRASAIVSGKADPLQMASEIRPDVPESVAAIVHSALSLNQEQRFISARAMWNALENALGLDFEEPPLDDVSVRTDFDSEPRIITAPADFPALDAYRAKSDQAEVEADNANVIAASGVSAADPLGGGDTGLPVGHSSDQYSEYSGPALDRAVIHLDTIDDGDVHEPLRDEDSIEQYRQEPTDRSPVPDRARTSTKAFEMVSRPAVWMPLLLIAAVLAIFGLADRSGDSQVQGTSAALPNDELPAAGEIPPASNNGPGLPSAIDTEIAADNIQAPGEDIDADTVGSPPSGGIVVNAAAETGVVEPRVERPSVSKSEKPNTEPAASDKEREVSDTPASRRNTGGVGRTAPQQTRRQRVGTERPRIVPEWDDRPSAVTIETVLTGVPYERRRRGETDWMDKEEAKEFRRRLKRMRRQSRDDFP